jgi:hypothetical protein
MSARSVRRKILLGINMPSPADSNAAHVSCIPTLNPSARARWQKAMMRLVILWSVVSTAEYN